MKIFNWIKEALFCRRCVYKNKTEEILAAHRDGQLIIFDADVNKYDRDFIRKIIQGAIDGNLVVNKSRGEG